VIIEELLDATQYNACSLLVPDSEFPYVLQALTLSLSLSLPIIIINYTRVFYRAPLSTSSL
jgi:hypothetical protein